MALFRGTLFTAASGSVDGVTFSHNRGGPYARARVVPVDPMTSEQEACRSAMANCANLWAFTLDDAGRAAWDRYAQTVTRPNRIGEERHLSGRALFTRHNIIRQQATIIIGDAYPEILVPPPTDACPPDSSVLTLPDTSTLHMDFNADPWTTTTGALLFVWISPPQAATINWFRSPMTLVRAFIGDEFGPPTTADVSLPDVYPSGARCFVKTRVQLPTGELSQERWQKIISP